MALKDYTQYAPNAVQGIGALMMMGQGQRDARLLRAQGRVARQQSIQDADAISREYRQLAGRQAAAMAQGGGTYDGSAAKLLHQSESLAFLDRLNVMYHGEMRQRDLNAEADSLQRRSMIGGVATLLGIGHDIYTRNKTKPKAGSA
jgi:hypothetical protein